MTLPTLVQIGPLAYTITDEEHVYNKTAVDQGEALWGRIDYAKGSIVLSPEQNDAHKRLALLHEVLHGVWHLHDKAHESDEDVLRSLTADLLDTLRRNPELVAYLVAS
jgi:hypothetical protein